MPHACYKTPTFCSFFDKVHNPLRLPCETTSERPKVLRTPQFFALFTSKCASRHKGVHFFDITTSKSAPKLRCFVHFHLEMCFEPQRRALFRHRNVQKCSEPVSFEHFWLGNVLLATPACSFSSLIWPAGSAPAALASLLFDPPEPQISGKTQCFATFSYLFAHLKLLSSHSFSFWSSFFFSSLLFSDSSHLCFSSVQIVGSWLPNFLRQWIAIIQKTSSQFNQSRANWHFEYFLTQRVGQRVIWSQYCHSHIRLLSHIFGHFCLIAHYLLLSQSLVQAKILNILLGKWQLRLSFQYSPKQKIAQACHNFKCSTIVVGWPARTKSPFRNTRNNIFQRWTDA